MRHFCTYFDSCYLARGLALHESLRQQCPEFTLWVLCFDQAAHEVLTKLDHPEIRPISQEDFLRGDDRLQAAREDRSLVEFYFTCSPSLPLYILKSRPEVDMVTYLDADLFFFSSPEPLFEEMGDRSIAVTPHRHPPELQHHDVYGLYNVGWLSFRRDEPAMACLNWWRDRCLEWCHDRAEDGKFADQKYLDEWPARFKSVAVLEHPGANLAAWNLAGTKLRHDGGITTVNGQSLIFYHFHNLKSIGPVMYEMAFNVYKVKPPRVLRRDVLTPYLRLLRQFENQARAQGPVVSGTREVRYWGGRADAGLSRLRRSARFLRSCAGLIEGIISRRYFLYLARRIL